MLKLNKIISINLFILLALNIITLIMPEELSGLILSLIVLVVQIGGNLLLAIIALINKDKSDAKSFFLSAFLVALIGFSACMAQMQII